MTVVMAIAEKSARGIMRTAFFVSSASLTISSKPMYAKKISAAAVKTPKIPRGISSKFAVEACGSPIAITIIRPRLSIMVAATAKSADSFIP